MKNTNIHKRYHNMKSRCYCKTHKTYDKYGGRGITVCEEWLNDINAFYDWAINNGYRKDLSLDRIDNNNGYSPENCRWTTMRKQNFNRRMGKNNTSGYIGVSLKKKRKRNRWKVSITNRGKMVYYKEFEELKTAVEARNKFIVENNLPHRLNKWNEEMESASGRC